MNRLILLSTWLGLLAGTLPAQAQEWASTRADVQSRGVRLAAAVSLNVENEPLDEILKEIERQTGYGFVYGTDVVRTVRRSLRVERQPLGTVLDALLPSGLGYQIRNRQVILSVKLPGAVERELTGRVTDASTGEGLPGVSLVVKNTKRGVTSTADGTYRLLIPDGSVVLSVSSIGYLPQEITVGAGQTALDVRLQQDTRNLDEVQVVAFGEQRSRDVTGSISTLKAADIRANLAASPDVALQGRAAGVQITQAGGTPGGAVRINIRGVASINSNSQPLIVIDGIPVLGSAFGTGGNAMNPLAEINPDDIESMEVLKDASASVLFGSRAANGVILITTKKGKSGKPTFDLSYQEGVSTATNRVEIIDNGADYFNLLKRAAANNQRAGLAPVVPNLANLVPAGILAGTAATIPANLLVDSTTLYTTRTNWLDQVLRTGQFRQATLGVSAGTKKLSAYLSGSYRNEGGIVIGQNFRRLAARLNLAYAPIKRLRLGLNSSVTGLENQTVPLSNSFRTAVTSALPAYPIQLPDGTFFNGLNRGNNQVTIGTNPLFFRANYSNQTNTLRTINTAFLEAEVVPGLSLRTEWGYDYQINRNDILQTPTLFPANLAAPPRERDGNGRAEQREFWSSTWNTNNLLTYTRTFRKDHQLKVLVGNSVQSQANVGNTYITENVPEGARYGLDTARAILTDDSPAFRFVSWFGRVNYIFRDKYLVEASFRTDGSSRFPPGNRWASFPGVSAGWILSEERFVRDHLRFVDFLKLRASYGATGNAEIGNFSWQKAFTVLGVNDAIYGGIQGARFVNPGNRALTWETTRQADLGLEFALAGNRLRGSLDVYQKTSEGLLLEYGLGPLFGTITNAMTVNLGTVRNRGVELTLRTDNVRRDRFTWTTDFNLSHNRNQVLSTYTAPFLNYEYQFFSGPSIAAPGYPLGTYYLPRFAGFDPATGNELFLERDRNQFTISGQTVPTGNLWDGTVNNQAANQAFLIEGRTPYPTLFGGLTNSFTYKSFDFSFLIYYQIGNWIYDQGERLQSYPSVSNTSGQVLRANVPGIGDLREELRRAESGGGYRLQLNSNARGFESTRFLHDGSFARLKNVALGYTLPSAAARKIKLRTARIYVTGQNLLTFTRFRGWDPEVFRSEGVSGPNQGVANLQPGVTNNDLPQVRTILVGLNLGF